MDFIAEKMQSERAFEDPYVDAFFASTLSYIQFLKQKGGAMGGKYDMIQALNPWRRVSSHPQWGVSILSGHPFKPFSL